MLSINTIAQVVVNAVQAAASPTSFNTGLILIPCSTMTGLQTYNSLSEAVAGLTTAEIASNTDAYKAVLKYFGASPAPSRLLAYYYTATGNTAKTPAEALAAVLNRTAEFYGVYAAGVTDETKIKDLEAAIRASEHPMMLFLPIPAPVETAVDDDELLAYFYGLSSRRVVSTYVAQPSDAAAIMGTAMGLQLAHPSSAFSLCYRTVNGIQPQNLTQSEVESIQALNGNVYVTRGYTHLLLEKGTTASGLRYDEALYLDMIANELQNEAVTMLADNDGKLPQTDDTTAQFINRFSAVLTRYLNMGVLSTGIWRGAGIGPLAHGDMIENGYTMWADSYDVQSDADRAAHKAMPISVALVLAGSVESIVISVNVVI